MSVLIDTHRVIAFLWRHRLYKDPLRAFFWTTISSLTYETSSSSRTRFVFHICPCVVNSQGQGTASSY